MGFHIRFNNKEEYLNLIKELKDLGYLNKEISIGTDMTCVMSIEDALNLNVKDKRKHYIRPSFSKETLINDNEYIILDHDITGLCINVEDRQYTLNNFPNQIGKDNVVIGFQTITDDMYGDIYFDLVEAKNAIEKINNIKQKEK